MESVKDALKDGEKIVLPGFGMFAVKTRPARQGRNPITGEVMAIPERKMPAFKAGKTLKDAVAGE
jgi:DNA-binding protein HU-beta